MDELSTNISWQMIVGQGKSMAAAQESLMRDARYTIEEMEASV
jgi:hypothetical protein